MKKNHVLTALLCAGLLLTTAANVFSQKTNFSGNWIIDPNVVYQSSFFLGEFNVLDKEDALTVQKITKDDYGLDALWNRALSYDGKVSEVNIPEDDYGTKRNSRESVKRTDDGKAIIITDNRITDHDDEIKKTTIMEYWTLSADGKKLTIKKEFYEEGKVKPIFEVQAIYNRK